MMLNNYEVPVLNWQQLAHDCCFSLNQTTKSHAQSSFYHFISSSPLEHTLRLVRQGSDTLLFVVFSYLGKTAREIAKQFEHLALIMGEVEKWQFTGSTFIRPQCAPLLPYVAKTVLLAVGLLLKHTFQHQPYQSMLLQYLQTTPSSYFKLAVLHSFIENIGVVDSEMGFIRFRTMIFRFQDNVIPFICQTLMPFFYSTEEALRIGELSQLQENLNVSQNQHRASKMRLNEQQQIQVQYVFIILREIVDFNYNITYSEYENEQPIDSCLISFPDAVLDKLTNPDFLTAVFFVVETVAEANKEMEKQYLAIGLECLAKILQSRLTYIKEDKKERFLYQAVKGLCRLLLKCQQIASSDLLEGILICNRKLFMNVELSYIKKSISNCESNKETDLYHDYLIGMTDMIVKIVELSEIKIDNHLLNEALELAIKLVLSYGFRDQQHLDSEQQFFRNFVRQIISKYIGNLCRSDNIFSTTRLLFLADNKVMVTAVFSLFKTLSSYDYGHLFNEVANALDYYLHFKATDSLLFANLLLLVSQLIDKHYLERNMFLSQAKDADVKSLSGVVKRASEIIQDHQKTYQMETHKEVMYLDIATIIFCEAILLEFLTSFDFAGRLRIKNRVYRLMFYESGCEENMVDVHSEEVLLSYMLRLLGYLQVEVGDSQEEAKMTYVLDGVEKCIFKLKWGMKRELFLRSHLFQQLCNYFDGLTLNSKMLPTLRSRISKIVVTLTFDDVLDEYKFRIDRMVAMIGQQDMLAIMYDLIGIFEGIETITIIKYFCGRLKRQVDMKQLFEWLFKAAVSRHQEGLYRDVFRLSKYVVMNKGMKINNGRLIYEMLGLILPNLNLALLPLLSSPSIDYDVWEEPLLEVLEMFNGMISGGHANVYLIESQGQGQFSRHLIIILRILLAIAKDVAEVPKLEEFVLTTINNINKEILDYIYDHQEQEMPQLYTQVTTCFTGMAMGYVGLTVNGNKTVEDRLNKSIDSLKHAFIYFNGKEGVTHRPQRWQNIRRHFEESEGINLQLMVSLMTLLLGNCKHNINYLRITCKLLFEMFRCNQPLLSQLLERLRISVERKVEFDELCGNYLKKDSEDTFIDFLKIWIKGFN